MHQETYVKEHWIIFLLFFLILWFQKSTEFKGPWRTYKHQNHFVFRQSCTDWLWHNFVPQEAPVSGRLRGITFSVPSLQVFHLQEEADMEQAGLSKWASQKFSLSKHNNQMWSAVPTSLQAEHPGRCLEALSNYSKKDWSHFSHKRIN